MGSLSYYVTLYLSIGMLVCLAVHSSPVGKLNIDRYVQSHYPPERHAQGYSVVQMFFILFWPLLFFMLKGRF